MSYTTFNIIGACTGVPSINNKSKIGVDLTIIALLVIAAVCIPNHRRLSLGLMSVALVVAGADIISLIARKILLGNFFVSQSEYFRAIILANQQAVSENASLEASAQPYHQILGNLCLGNAEGFLQTTSTIAYRSPNAPGEIYGANPGQFTTVITACPIAAMGAAMNVDTVRTDFANSKIEWQYVGRTWEDAPEYWWAMVHDCTLSGKERIETVVIASRTKEGHEIHYREIEDVWDKTLQEKTEKMEGSSSLSWFEPLFQIMDRAIEGRRTLLHCHAGISRSSSLLAAYLINRFDVSAEQAVTFLQNRRACVNPKFMAQLKNYEMNLRGHQLLRSIYK